MIFPLLSRWTSVSLIAVHASWVWGSTPTAVIEKARQLFLKDSNRNGSIEVFCGRHNEALASEFIAHGFSHVGTIGRHHFEEYLDR